MNKLKFLIFVLILGFSFNNVYSSNPPDNNLIKYYSALIGINLNHCQESSKIIYHLSKEPSFEKSILENELKNIEEFIGFTNTNISNLIINTTDDQHKQIDTELKNIDKHLAQAFVDIKSIRNDLNKQKDLAPSIADLYQQLNKAENEDHQEIKRILKLKDFDEPVLVKPKG